MLSLFQAPTQVTKAPTNQKSSTVAPPPPPATQIKQDEETIEHKSLHQPAAQLTSDTADDGKSAHSANGPVFSEQEPVISKSQGKETRGFELPQGSNANVSPAGTIDPMTLSLVPSLSRHMTTSDGHMTAQMSHVTPADSSNVTAIPQVDLMTFSITLAAIAQMSKLDPSTSTQQVSTTTTSSTATSEPDDLIEFSITPNLLANTYGASAHQKPLLNVLSQQPGTLKSSLWSNLSQAGPLQSDTESHPGFGKPLAPAHSHEHNLNIISGSGSTHLRHLDISSSAYPKEQTKAIHDFMTKEPQSNMMESDISQLQMHKQPSQLKTTSFQNEQQSFLSPKSSHNYILKCFLSRASLLLPPIGDEKSMQMEVQAIPLGFDFANRFHGYTFDDKVENTLAKPQWGHFDDKKCTSDSGSRSNSPQEV